MDLLAITAAVVALALHAWHRYRVRRELDRLRHDVDVLILRDDPDYEPPDDGPTWWPYG